MKIHLNSTLEGTQDDSDEYGIITDDNLLHIFQDDGLEFLSSAVAGLEVHIRALSASDVAALNLNMVNVPGPLPLLGAGAAFGSSRVSRQRLRLGAQRPG